MIDSLFLLTIVLMAAVTYLTRIGGYLLLQNRTIGSTTQTVLKSAPGCVLITVIAPHFVTGKVSDLLALAVTVVAAMRLPILPTVIIAIISAGVLRHLMG